MVFVLNSLMTGSIMESAYVKPVDLHLTYRHFILSLSPHRTRIMKYSSVRLVQKTVNCEQNCLQLYKIVLWIWLQIAPQFSTILEQKLKASDLYFFWTLELLSAALELSSFWNTTDVFVILSSFYSSLIPHRLFFLSFHSAFIFSLFHL